MLRTSRLVHRRGFQGLKLNFQFSSLLQVGDRVVALPEYKAWAELVAVPTKFVYKIPDELSFQDAAAITMNYLVAYIIVFELLSIRPGKSLILHSAAGGVVSTIFFYISFNIPRHIQREGNFQFSLNNNEVSLKMFPISLKSILKAQ